MHSHELLQDILRKGSAKQIADDTHMSLSTIYKWAEPPEPTGSGAPNPLDRLETLYKATGDERLIQWMAERAGGFFIRNPKGQWPHSHDLLPATNRILQDFADLLSVIAMAAADNHISKTEAKTIRARWEELKSVTEGFVRCSEEGNFGPIKRELSTPPTPSPGTN